MLRARSSGIDQSLVTFSCHMTVANVYYPGRQSEGLHMAAADFNMKAATPRSFIWPPLLRG